MIWLLRFWWSSSYVLDWWVFQFWYAAQSLDVDLWKTKKNQKQLHTSQAQTQKDEDDDDDDDDGDDDDDDDSDGDGDGDDDVKNTMKKKMMMMMMNLWGTDCVMNWRRVILGPILYRGILLWNAASPRLGSLKDQPLMNNLQYRISSPHCWISPLLKVSQPAYELCWTNLLQ